MNRNIRIVGRFDSYTGIGHQGWTFVEALNLSKNDLKIEAVVTNPEITKSDLVKLKSTNITVTNASDIVGQSDIALFCDVLFQGGESLHQLGKINVLYFVWDSTRVPSSFIKIMKADFDLIIVPSEFVKKSLINSGLTIDILIVPYCVEAPVKLKCSSKERFTFGFIGSLETRKNVDLLIESFIKSIGEAADLRIHLSYSHLTEDKLEELTTKYNISNINITHGHIGKNEFFAIINSIDCFVSLSKGEGFSLIPHEYMHLERPIVLSYSSAHTSIPNMNGVWFIESEIPYPALYPQIDNKYHGVFKGPYIEDVVLALREVWDEVKQKKSYPELSEYARKFNSNTLSERYLSVVSPKKIIKSSFLSHISPDLCLTLKSDELINKYNSSILEASEINKHVVIANDGGFFSIFNRYISILAHELESNSKSIIIPDWRLTSLKEYLGHSSFTSFCYGTEDDGNIFLKIFNPPNFDIPIEYYNDDDFLRDHANIRTDYNENKEPDLTYIHAYKLYKRNDFQAWREMYHKYFSKHISLRADLQHQIDEFKKSNFEGCYVIAAHIRHPSHSMEQPSSRLPTVEVFKEHINKQLSIASKSQDKPVKLFIASDQDSVIKYFRMNFSNILITTHATRTTKENDQTYQNANSSEKRKEGYQIQHIMASDESKWSVKMADEVIIDTWLLAASNEFIHITSNIATAVSFINPKVQMIYCE